MSNLKEQQGERSLENDGINVLSLFDGMSCGRIALQRAGFGVDKYYSSEIDKYAITVADANWPQDTKNRLGDVTKWKEWDIDWSSIDLLIGGSPCQGFSFAGKQLAFDDPRSKLFFVYVDILNHIRKFNPNVKFLLENVKMKKEYLDVISEKLDVESVFINSNLVSAQNRQRYYWCNWPLKAPQDRGVLVKDVLDDKAFYKVCKVVFNNRIKGFTENDRGIRFHRGDSRKSGVSELGRILKPSATKTDTITTNHAPKTLLSRTDSTFEYRYFTAEECEKLQTVPAGYTSSVINSERLKMLGNGWTVDVIAHIFREMIK